MSKLAKPHHAQITRRTDDLAASLGITDQLVGMATAQKLANIAIRFQRLNTADASNAAAQCLAMAALAN